jgi:hypothetical protein
MGMGIVSWLRQKAACVVHAGIGLSIGAPVPIKIKGRRGNGVWDRPLLAWRAGRLLIDLAQRWLSGADPDPNIRLQRMRRN